MIVINSPRDNPDFVEEVLTPGEWLLLSGILANIQRYPGSHPFDGLALEDWPDLKELIRKVSHNAG